MKNNIHQFIKYSVIVLIAVTCKKSYTPPAITAINNFLVVDGNINATPASSTIITLSRTRRLVDTVTNIPESNAQVFIENNNGVQYPLHETGNGKYVSDELTLNGSNTYRLDITTANGKNYKSDFVPVKQTPAIDSLNWKRDKERPRSRQTEWYRHIPRCHLENRPHRRWSQPGLPRHQAF